MPPRVNNGNAVRGPSSALTSFLREQGITAQHPIGFNGNARAGPAGPQAPAAPSQPQAGPSTSRRTLATTTEEAEEDQDAAPRTLKKKRKIPELSDSEDLDGSDAESTLTVRQKKEKAMQKLAAKKRKAAAKKDDPYEDEGDDDDDGFASVPTVGRPSAAAPPAIGSFAVCGECDSRFTVTKYSPPSPLRPSELLCHACTIKNGLENYKPKAAVKKRTTAASKKVEKRKIVNYEEAKRVPTLLDICIKIIADHVEDVESLGGLDPATLNKVNIIICKSRKMTSETAQLFYDASITHLHMNDCTLIKPPGFQTLVSLCPSLTSLTLSLCGQLDSSSLLAIGRQLRGLTRLELYGPFLVRKEAWVDFFGLVEGRLEGLLVTQSPRFDLDCVNAMVERCGGSLVELRLCEMGKLDDAWLGPLSNITCLTSLDLSRPSESLEPATTPSLPILLSSLGPSLTHLSLASHSHLTVPSLLPVLPPNLPSLSSLDLSLLPLLDDAPFADLLTAWLKLGNAGLEVVRLAGCHALGDLSLAAILALAADRNLTLLDVSGWKDLSEDALRSIGTKAPSLRILDLGWTRNLDDFILKEIVDATPDLERVVLWGCNKVTSLSAAYLAKRKIHVVGIESQSYALA